MGTSGKTGRRREVVDRPPAPAASIIAWLKQGFDALMELHDAQPAKLLGDKGYVSDAIRNDLAKRGIEPVIPLRSNRTTPIEYDREAYKRRNLIERCVNRLTVPPHRDPLRKNCRSLHLNALYCSCKALDQTVNTA